MVVCSKDRTRSDQENRTTREDRKTALSLSISSQRSPSNEAFMYSPSQKNPGRHRYCPEAAFSAAFFAAFSARAFASLRGQAQGAIYVREALLDSKLSR